MMISDEIIAGIIGAISSLAGAIVGALGTIHISNKETKKRGLDRLKSILKKDILHIRQNFQLTESSEDLKFGITRPHIKHEISIYLKSRWAEHEYAIDEYEEFVGKKHIQSYLDAKKSYENALEMQLAGIEKINKIIDIAKK
jgi:hypothetical protein